MRYAHSLQLACEWV